MRKKGGIWSHVSTVEGSPGSFCKYCGEEVSPRAARIEAHLARCQAAPSIEHGARPKSSPVKTKDENEVKLSGRPKGGVWRHFTPAVSSKTTVTCLHCGEEVSARAGRVSAHIARCQPEQGHASHLGREEDRSREPLLRLLEFVIRSLEDLINCRTYQILDGEMKQRLRHLFLITKLGHRGNKKQIANLLDEHEAALVRYCQLRVDVDNNHYIFRKT